MDIESVYRRHCDAKTAISAHLPRLRELSAGLDTVVEFGVKRGASSSSFLLGAKKVVSFDIAATREAQELKEIAPHWSYRLEDSRFADVPECDLLFIDSQHDYEQVSGELKHAGKVRRFIVGHDTTTFGVIGARGETGTHKWTYVKGQSVPLNCLGIRFAYDDLMIRDPAWRIKAHYPDSHGLLVLERR